MGVGRGQRVGGLYVQMSVDGTERVEREMQDVRTEMDRTERSMESVERRADALQGAFFTAAAGAAALGIGLAALVRRFSRVESTFARIQAQSQASEAVMADLRQTAIQLGSDLPIVMHDAAQGAYELTTAGLSATEAMEALSGVSYLAVSGQLQMAEAANVTVAALNAFDLEADKANAVADLFASTAAATATEVRDLGQAFTYSASAANQAGQSMTDLAAAIGVVSNAGIRGSMAGTSLQQVFSRLANPTAKAEEAMASLGLTTQDFVDSAGNLRSINEIVALLNDRMQGLTAVERSALLEDMFGERGRRAMGVLLAQADELNNVLAEISRAQIGGAVVRLQDISQEELDIRQQQIGFELQPGTTAEVLRQFQANAERHGLTQQELALTLEMGLDIDQRAAELLAGDLVRGANIDRLASSIDSSVTSAELAAAAMDTLGGQIERVLGALDAFAFQMYRAAAGPLSLFLDVALAIVEPLSQNETAARILGIALVGLTAAAGATALALGVMWAEAQLTAFWLTATEGRSYGLAAAQWVLTTASRAASGALWLMTASLADIRAALVATRAAQLWTAASSITLSGALGAASGAMTVAAGAATTLWAALGPIGWIVLGLIALWAAWKSGLLDFIGLGPEADAVVAALGATLGFLGDALGFVADALGWVIGGVIDLLGFLLRLVTLPIVLPIKALGVALRVVGDVIGGLLSPLDRLWSLFDGTATAADWLFAALMLIPGVNIAVWFLDAANAADLLRGAIDFLLTPIEWLVALLGFINRGGFLDGLLGDFTLLGTVVAAVTSPLDVIIGLLSYINRGGFLDGLLGDFTLLGSLIAGIEFLLAPIIAYLQFINRGGFLDGLLGDFTLLGAAIRFVTDPIGVLIDYLSWINRGGFLDGLLGEFTLLGTVIGAVTVPFRVLLDVIGAVVGILTLLYDLGAAFGGWLLGGIMGQAAEAANDLAYAAGFAYGILQGLYNLGAGFVGWLFAPVIESVSAGLGWLGTQADRAAQFINGLVQAGLGLGRIALAPLIFAFNFLAAVAQQAERFIDGIVNAVSQLVGIALSPFTAAFTVLQGVLNGILGTIDRIIAGVNQIPVVGWLIPDAKQPATEQGRQAGKGTAEGFAAGASEGEAWVANAASGLMQTVGRYLPGSDADTGPLSTLTASGRALPVTFAEGIQATAGRTEQAAGQVAQHTMTGLPSEQLAREQAAAVSNTLSDVLTAPAIPLAEGIGQLLTPFTARREQPDREPAPVETGPIEQVLQLAADVPLPIERPRLPPAQRERLMQQQTRVLETVETVQQLPAPDVSLPALPDVSVPSLPALPEPTISVPDVPVPAVPDISVPSLPTIPEPTVSVPDVPMPAAPAIDLPDVSVPALPDLSVPALPALPTPDVSVPDVSLPSLPDVSLPALPDVSVPTLPAFPSLPDLSVPVPDLPSLAVEQPEPERRAGDIGPAQPPAQTVAVDAGQPPQPPAPPAGEQPRSEQQQQQRLDVTYSPTFEIDARGAADDIDELESRIQRIAERGIRDLRRELETDFFRFGSGQ